MHVAAGSTARALPRGGADVAPPRGGLGGTNTCATWRVMSWARATWRAGGATRCAAHLPRVAAVARQLSAKVPRAPRAVRPAPARPELRGADDVDRLEQLVLYGVLRRAAAPRRRLHHRHLPPAAVVVEVRLRRGPARVSATTASDLGARVRGRIRAFEPLRSEAVKPGGRRGGIGRNREIGHHSFNRLLGGGDSSGSQSTSPPSSKISISATNACAIIRRRCARLRSGCARGWLPCRPRAGGPPPRTKSR